MPAAASAGGEGGDPGEKAKRKDDKLPPHQRPDLVSPGTVIKQRWQVVGRIGAGGFGQIHRAIDIPSGKHVAIKLEAMTIPKSVLKMEVAVLKEMCEEACVARFYGCGRTPAFNFLVMSLVGQNISELRKGQPGQRFSLPTGLEVGRQMLEGIRAVHDHGVLHRDIKPSNFAIGCGTKDESRRVYTLDFGLARLYRTSTGAVRPARTFAGFRGTARYASLNAHRSQELSRRDDLISFFYMMVELIEGQLPWHSLRDKKEVLPSKEKYSLTDLARRLPEGFSRIAQSIDLLEYSDRPNYELILQELQDMLHNTRAPVPLVFDWEVKRAALTDDNPRSSQADQQQAPPPASATHSGRLGEEDGKRLRHAEPEGKRATAIVTGTQSVLSKKPPPAPLRPLRAAPASAGPVPRREASHERASLSESDRDRNGRRSAALSLRGSEAGSQRAPRAMGTGAVGDSEQAMVSQNMSSSNNPITTSRQRRASSGALQSLSSQASSSHDADDSTGGVGENKGSSPAGAPGSQQQLGAKSQAGAAAGEPRVGPDSVAVPQPVELDAADLSEFNLQEENLKELELMALDELDAAIEHGRAKPLVSMAPALSSSVAITALPSSSLSGKTARSGSLSILHKDGKQDDIICQSQGLLSSAPVSPTHGKSAARTERRTSAPEASESCGGTRRPAPPPGPPPARSRRSVEYRKTRFSAGSSAAAIHIAPKDF